MTCEAGRCTCPDGFRDADGALGNGCECPVTNDGVEVCDGRDNDCDGEADEGFDEDGDGFPIVDGCRPGYPADCDDADPERSPGTAERCNGVDDDCDGETDEEFDLAGDPSHCGECGRSCRVPGARLACIGGRCPWECTEEETGDPRCGLHCLPGAVDENGDPADGCEATPCTLQRLPEYEVEEPAPLPVAQPAFLAWRAFADGWLTTGLPEQGPGAVQPLAIRDGAAVLGTARGSGELADEPFPVAGVAVADGSPVLLDAAAWRLLVLDAEELAQTGEHLLPLPAGAGFMGLSWDGAGYWFGHAGTGAVLRMVPGDHAVQRFFALGPVRDLALDAAGGRVFLALPGRICVHTSGRGTCRACWAPPADGPEALGIAWDGDRLWVVDDSGGLYRVELP